MPLSMHVKIFTFCPAIQSRSGILRALYAFYTVTDCARIKNGIAHIQRICVFDL